MAVIQTGAPANIKVSIFNLQFFSHFYMDFYATKMSRITVERPFWLYITHICRVQRFQDISEKREVIDTNCP